MLTREQGERRQGLLLRVVVVVATVVLRVGSKLPTQSPTKQPHVDRPYQNRCTYLVHHHRTVFGHTSLGTVFRGSVEVAEPTAFMVRRWMEGQRTAIHG